MSMSLDSVWRYRRAPAARAGGAADKATAMIHQPTVAIHFAIVLLGLSATPVAAQRGFPCTGPFMVQNDPADLQRISQTLVVDGGTATLGVELIPVPLAPPLPSYQINALGFSVLDFRLYGFQRTSDHQLLAIDGNGVITPLGLPMGLPAAAFTAGDVTAYDGSTMFLIAGHGESGDILYRVDLTSPTFAVTSVVISGDDGRVGDWAHNPRDELLYGGDRTDGQVAVLNPDSVPRRGLKPGERRDLDVPGLPACPPPPADCDAAGNPRQYGGAWVDPADHLFLYNNDIDGGTPGPADGRLFEIADPGGAPRIVNTQIGPATSLNDAAACMPLDLSSSLDIDKDGTLDVGADGIANPGDEVTYTFILRNTGNVTVFRVAVIDAMAAPITCETGPVMPPDEIAALPATATVNCAGTYALTQADIDAGRVENDATVQGTDPNGDPISEFDFHQLPIPTLPSILLTKTGTLDPGPDGGGDPGDVIAYTFLVTNTGNVTLVDALVSDAIVDPIACPGGNPIPSLAPAATELCTGSYVVTQADVDAGQKDNTATVTAQDTQGNPVTAQDSHSVPIPTGPDIAVEIPTVGRGGLALLAWLVLSLGILFLRRRLEN